MWPVIAALVGGAANSGGAWFTNTQQNRYNERMANSAHQREVRDLEAAGLNPILSATGGSGAATPSFNPVNVGEGLGNAIASATHYMSIDKPHLDNETRMTEANSAKVAADTELAQAGRRNADADTLIKLQTVDRGDLTKQALEASIRNTEQTTRTSSAEEAYSRSRTTKTDEETKVLKTLVPFLQQGGKAMQQLLDKATAGGPIGDALYDWVETLKKGGDLPHLSGMPAATAIDYIINVIKKHAPTIWRTLKSHNSSNDPWSGASGTQAP